MDPKLCAKNKSLNYKLNATINRFIYIIYMLCVCLNNIVVSREIWTPAIQFKQKCFGHKRTDVLVTCLKNRSAPPPT